MSVPGEMRGSGEMSGAGAVGVGGSVVRDGGAARDIGSAASTVSVQIGALVVDGLSGSPPRGVQVVQALGPALERLFERQGVPECWQAGGELESLALTIADLPADAADWRVVDALARALYRALDRTW